MRDRYANVIANISSILKTVFGFFFYFLDFATLLKIHNEYFAFRIVHLSTVESVLYEISFDSYVFSNDIR